LIGRGDEALRHEIELLAAEPAPDVERTRAAVERLLAGLEDGSLRAAHPGPDGWTACPWVKRGILLGFRVATDRSIDAGPVFHFRDRDLFPTQDPSAAGREVRIVPGGTTVRRGAFVDRGVVIMPPAFVNVGAFVGAGTMIDSHVLVGSCAQIGRGVHLSAGVQVGGVLEPAGALPVIVEDGAFVGGGAGIYEGTRIGSGAVIAPGVILTRATPLYDLVHERVVRAAAEEPLAVPAGAVVVPGSRPAGGAWAREHGLQLQAPVVVKYRDARTAAAVALEEALRRAESR